MVIFRTGDPLPGESIGEYSYYIYIIVLVGSLSKSKRKKIKNHRFPVESVEFPQQIQESHHLDLGPCPRP